MLFSSFSGVHVHEQHNRTSTDRVNAPRLLTRSVPLESNLVTVSAPL